MKYFLLTYLTIAFFSLYGQQSAQEYIEKKEYIEKYDTLKSITILNPDNQKIILKKNNTEFRFNKDITLKMIKKDIEEKLLIYKNSKGPPEDPVLKNLYDIAIRDVDELQTIIKYIQSSEYVIIKPNDPKKNYEQIKNDIGELTSLYLLERFYCELIDSGNFSLLKNKVLQTRVSKVKIFYSNAVSGTSDIMYILSDGEVVWVCPY